MNTAEGTNAKVSVLILDGNADFRQAVSDKLSQKGFKIIDSTSNPKQAIECIRTHRPNIVIFDVILPQTDGIAFLKNAIGLHTENAVNYIAVSSFSSDVIIKETMRLGAAHYLTKPVDFDLLAERMMQICGKDCIQEQPTAKRHADSAGASCIDDLEEQVTKIILEIGIPAHVKGYHYVRSAIMLAVDSPDAINAVTKIIYPTIAKQYKTSSSRVERAIRHAIEVAWDRGNVDTLVSIFGYSISSSRGKPTNSEFIAMISDRLRLKNKSAPRMAYTF